ncbi:MAG: lipoyl(octanoyl) transferase LipB [Chitinophagales bacterium]|jgi:lipoyl(octanoyl) transferase|nr:lipoyl(octanoyl) transferase LipB [Sphingobacteriales bacterium]
MSRDIVVDDLGIIEYKDAERLQLDCFETKVSAKNLKIQTDNKLFLLEHYPVYTLGKNADEKNILPIARTSGASFHHISRGGDVTFHGPGQLVAYPILDLQDYNMGVRAYVTALENIGIELCSSYGIEAKASDEEGVWVDYGTSKARKIMAIGIKVSRYITMHGIAFNVNTDLNYFSFIIPCGIPNKGVTSLQRELGRELDMNEFKERYVEIFKKYFN